MTQPAEIMDDPLWYKDVIVYQLHVKTFFDSNGDGYGDFAGLIEKLDYIEQLGVNCLWILPFYPSPLKDDGYDIADYVSINPLYGTMQDAKNFIKEAHRRNIRVITELVINHTSDQHEWFKRAKAAPPGSNERNYYVWSDTDAKFNDARIIFIDTEASNWTWDSTAKAYYWHRFFSHQPDLNFDNPEVTNAVLDVMRFWLDIGVDGFRLDAIPYLIEREGTNCENLPETHAILKQFRAALDKDYKNKLFLAEANQWPADVIQYFGSGNDECHMAYHFPLMPRIFMALHQQTRTPIVEIMRQTPEIPESCQWAIFLRNHDELTLEMVTDEERDYMYAAYAEHPIMRCNVGIRRRLAPLLENSRSRVELANSLLFSMPGTPIVYYGDEIGMGDNVYLGDRNGVRTPMQWNGDRNGGFSRASFAQLYSPPLMDPVSGYQVINVEAQQLDKSSLLHWMRRIIRLRKQYKVFGRGTIEFIEPANRKVLAYIRKYENETVLCLANLSYSPQSADLHLEKYAGKTPVEMFGMEAFHEITEQPYVVTFGPYGFYWLLLEK
jgi:maltose alpha-D-glucosyltransferase/alpha-amylase